MSDETYAYGADGTRLYVRRRPGGEDGAQVILSDGVACEGFVWRYLWDELPSILGPSASPHVAHHHYRGHGRSSAPVDPERLSVVDFARDLDAIRTFLGDPPRTVLVGHSFGVQVSLEAYRLRPEGIAGLILICGAPGKVTQTFKNTTVLADVLPKVIAWAEQHPAIVRALWARTPIDLSMKVAYLLGEVDAKSMRPDDFRPYLEHITHLDPTMFFKILRGAGEHSAEDLLPEIKVPVLVVAAERDTFTPPELAVKMAQAIPQGELLMLEGGTHAAPIEQPERVREAIAAFLRKL
ncbi:MAG: alpha/beta hydrolase [Myxococcales bacterium]|nr:alpha/beta hydrolase [Myxococcales bacterium]